MRKLRLELEELVIESFDTRAERTEKGTVHGRETVGGDSYDGACGTYYCLMTDEPSCLEATCMAWSCQSCNGHTCSCVPGECP